MTSKDCRINPLSGRAIIVGGPDKYQAPQTKYGG